MSTRALRAASAVLAAPARALRTRNARPRRAACCAARASASSVVARWSINARFGCKSQALALVRGPAARALCTRFDCAGRLQLGEWVVNVAAQAGVEAEDARILASQLGAPESRLELELRFGSLADMEEFFNTLPVADHAAWGVRLAPLVCDGSPTWHTFRVVDVAGASPSVSKAAAAQPPPPPLPAVMRRSAGGLFLPPEAEAQRELDWKGEPLTWSAGDRFPRVAD